MGVFDVLFGSEDEVRQMPTKTPQQMKLLNQNIGQARQLGQGGFKDALSILQQYLDPQSDIYKNFEQPYLNEYYQQTLPELAERFGGLNAMGSGLQTSGFGQALGAAGANLQGQLAQMKQQYQRQSIQDLLNQYNQMTSQGLGTNTFENAYQPGNTGIAGPLLQGAATAAGTAIGGPAGGFLANQFSSLFNPQKNQSNPFGIGQPQSSGGGYQGSFGPLPNFQGY